MAKKVTLSDVATKANVSTATVSYILNQTPGHSFSQDTIQRVLDAVQELQYNRSSAVQKLRELPRSKGLICLAYAPNSERIYKTARGAIDELTKQQYDVIQTRLELTADTGKSHPTFENQLPENVDGIICLQAAGLPLDDDWVNTIIERRLPFVTADSQWSRDISSVEFNYLEGAYQLTQHLLQKNIKKIYHLYMPYETAPQIQEQLRGIRRAVYESGKDVELISILDPVFPMSDRSSAIGALHEAMPELDAQSAVVLGFAYTAQYVLRLTMDLGLQIPIASLERGELDPVAFPQLICSDLPLRKMGVLASQALLALMQSPDNIVHDVLTPELIY